MADASSVLRTLLLSALSLPARSAAACAADQAAVASEGDAAGNAHYMIEFVLILGLCIAACMVLSYRRAARLAHQELLDVRAQYAYQRHDRDIQTEVVREGAEEEESDDFGMESPAAQRRRYLDSTMSECSDPDMWAELHYRPAYTSFDDAPMDISFDSGTADEVPLNVDVPSNNNRVRIVSADDSRPHDPLMVMDMITRSNVDGLQIDTPEMHQALGEIHRMLREAENHGLSQEEARQSLLQAINHGLRQRQLRRAMEAGDPIAAGSMESAAAIGVPALELEVPNSTMDTDQMIQEARRSQMSALVAISQRVLEAEDANDHEAIEYWQNQYDLIHSLM